MPASCIEKVECQIRDKTLYERLSTPRLAPKIVLKSAWTLKQQQQEQQQQDTPREAVGNRKRSKAKVPQQTTQTPEASGNRCEVLSNFLRLNSMILKLISELKEFHKMQYLEMKKG